MANNAVTAAKMPTNFHPSLWILGRMYLRHEISIVFMKYSPLKGLPKFGDAVTLSTAAAPDTDRRLICKRNFVNYNSQVSIFFANRQVLSVFTPQLKTYDEKIKN